MTILIGFRDDIVQRFLVNNLLIWANQNLLKYIWKTFWSDPRKIMQVIDEKRPNVIPPPDSSFILLWRFSLALSLWALWQKDMPIFQFGSIVNSICIVQYRNRFIGLQHWVFDVSSLTTNISLIYTHTTRQKNAVKFNDWLLMRYFTAVTMLSKYQYRQHCNSHLFI